MTHLRLKLGGLYLSRDGREKIKIVRRALKTDPVFRKTHPFVDREGYAYMPDGRTHPDKVYPFDLVKRLK